MTPPKRIAFFYYDGFVEFEIALAYLYLMDHRVFSMALEDRDYRSFEGQRFLPDCTLDSLDPESLDLLVIPGGNPVSLMKEPRLRTFVERAIAGNTVIAGICGGVDWLVSMGFLQGKRCIASTHDSSNPPFVEEAYRKTVACHEGVVSDGAFVTATGESYREFARALVLRLGGSDAEIPL